jgi:hypothetical protein
MTQNRITIISCAKKGSRKSSSNYVESYLHALDENCIDWVYVPRAFLPNSNGCNSKFFRALTYILTKSKALNLIRLYFFKIRLKYRANEPNTLNKNVWVIACSPEVVFYALSYAFHSQNVHTTVSLLDSINYQLVDNLSLFNSHFLAIKQDYINLFDRASLVTTMGKRMKDSLSVSAGKSVDSLYLKPLSNLSVDFVNIKKKQTEGEVKVIFAGSLYAKDAWNSFARAVELHNKDSNYQVRIIYCGIPPSDITPKSKFVEYKGYVSFEELKVNMLQCDFAYLPYFSSQFKSDVFETSFPSKFSDYLSFNLPIFLHAPSNAEVSEYLCIKNLGVQESSIDPIQVKDSLCLFIEKMMKGSFDKNIESAYRKDFSKKARLNFRKSLLHL